MGREEDWDAFNEWRFNPDVRRRRLETPVGEPVDFGNPTADENSSVIMREGVSSYTDPGGLETIKIFRTFAFDTDPIESRIVCQTL